MPMCAASSFSVGERPSLASSVLRASFSLLALRAHQPRHPVHRPQLVEHRAADTRHAVGFELHAARQVERVDRVHQAEHAGRDQVVQLDAVGQPRPDPLAVVLHQRQVLLDEPIAKLLVGRIGLEVLPDFINFNLLS